MSRKISGSGGSHSFGGSGGGSRSFGGSSPGRGTRHLSGSGGSSRSSSGGLSGLDSDDLVSSVIGLAFSLFGWQGGIAVCVGAILVYLGINYPKAFGIVFAILMGIVLLLVIFWPRKKEKPDPDRIADLLADGNPKYDMEMIHTESFTRHMLAELSDRACLNKDGNLEDDRIDTAVRSFDDIYRKYVRENHYLSGQTETPGDSEANTSKLTQQRDF